MIVKNSPIFFVQSFSISTLDSIKGLKYIIKLNETVLNYSSMKVVIFYTTYLLFITSTYTHPFSSQLHEKLGSNRNDSQNMVTDISVVVILLIPTVHKKFKKKNMNLN